MSAKKEDGGPAFAVRGDLHYDGCKWSGVPSSAGMSLRDYAAVAVMQGMIASGGALPTSDSYQMHKLGMKAYALADGLIAAREETR